MHERWISGSWLGLLQLVFLGHYGEYGLIRKGAFTMIDTLEVDSHWRDGLSPTAPVSMSILVKVL